MFHLSQNTKIRKVIPKNAFDKFTNTRQKKIFSDKVQRITWCDKIAFDTVNLQGNDVTEIQVFKIELKQKTIIKEVLEVIQKSIPYHIIFWIEFGDEFYISTAVKHTNVKDENSSVIDYTFSTDWQLVENNPYQIELKNNLDWVFKNFCNQLKTVDTDTKNIKELVEKQKEYDREHREILQLKSEIIKCKQFNKKVELNLKLKELQSLRKTQS